MRKIIIGNTKFDIGARTYIIGIVNLTPDSFYDGGKYNSIDKAISYAEKLISEGADIIEIGGESARPGATPVEEEVELSRVLPVLKELKKHINVPISIDTRRAPVAEQAIYLGASMINDFGCLKKHENMAAVCSKHNVTCCIMHNRNNMDYNNFIIDVISDLNESIDIALNAGIAHEKIIIDPGIGFAKTDALNISVMKNLEEFSKLKYPVLLGTSRKTFIGNILGLPQEERLEGTLATTALAISKHCDFIRVHDVKANKRVCIIADEIIRGRH